MSFAERVSKHHDDPEVLVIVLSDSSSELFPIMRWIATADKRRRKNYHIDGYFPQRACLSPLILCSHIFLPAMSPSCPSSFRSRFAATNGALAPDFCVRSLHHYSAPCPHLRPILVCEGKARLPSRSKDSVLPASVHIYVSTPAFPPFPHTVSRYVSLFVAIKGVSS